MLFTVASIFLSVFILPGVNGHGMMIDPPGRASRWRFGFAGPKHYTDNELSCGGRHVQWNTHGGKCGVCGDVYNAKNPKYVYPGAYATDPPIVKTYYEGQTFTAVIRITANHKGFFEFTVGELGNPPIKEEDLSFVVRSPSGDDKWYLTSPASRDFEIPLKLPSGFTCEHCVIRWKWSTGNNHINTTPETFVSCADIRIVPRSGGGGPNPPRPKPTRPPAAKTTTTQPPPVTEEPVQPGGKGCKSNNGSAAMDAWCKNNCAAGYCPSRLCKCE